LKQRGLMHRRANQGGLDALRFPALTVATPEGVRFAKELPPAPGTREIECRATARPEDIIAWLLERLSAGRSAVWFRNTEDFTHLLAAAGLPAPILFHSRFLSRDRARIEELV
jgi:CRISPR/Cas system-associated endonuclease/helicase Cas3